MKKINIIRFILVICIITWAIFVFHLSNQNGNQSSGLSRKITAIWIHDEEKIDTVEPYVRKIAHFSEYTLGGMLFIALFVTYDWTEKRKIITSILIGIWYASIDEIHQVFVESRSGSIKDVFIDSLGIVFGVFFMLLIIQVFQKIRKRIGKNRLEE